MGQETGVRCLRWHHIGISYRLLTHFRLNKSPHIYFGRVDLCVCVCWGLTTRVCRQPLWVILYRLPEKGRKDSKGDEREGQRRKRNRNESEETE